MNIPPWLRRAPVVVILVIAGCSMMGAAGCIAGGVDTACTDGKTIFISSEFIERATDGELALVVLHEAGHIALRHMTTGREDKDQELAADQWALSMLRPGIDMCRLARLLKARDRPDRAAILCEELE